MFLCFLPSSPDSRGRHTQPECNFGCFTPFSSVYLLLFLWAHSLSHLCSSTRQQGQKAEANPWCPLAPAWRISEPLPSLSAMVLVERATTLPTSSASGWARWSSSSSLSALLPPRPSKRGSSGLASAAARCAWRTCRSRNAGSAAPD